MQKKTKSLLEELDAMYIERDQRHVMLSPLFQRSDLIPTLAWFRLQWNRAPLTRLPGSILFGVIAVTHRASRRNLRSRCFAAMAAATGFQVRQNEIGCLGRFGSRMAAFTCLGRMRVMIEPAMHHVPHRLVYRDNRPIRRTGTWCLDDMTVITSAPRREHRTNGGIAGRTARADGGEIGIIDLPLCIAAGSAADHAAKLHGARRTCRPVEGAEIRDHLGRIAVAQGTGGAAHLVKGKAVAGLAILLHVDRLKARSIR